MYLLHPNLFILGTFIGSGFVYLALMSLFNFKSKVKRLMVLVLSCLTSLHPAVLLHYSGIYNNDLGMLFNTFFLFTSFLMTLFIFSSPVAVIIAIYHCYMSYKSGLLFHMALRYKAYKRYKLRQQKHKFALQAVNAETLVHAQGASVVLSDSSLGGGSKSSLVEQDTYSVEATSEVIKTKQPKYASPLAVHWRWLKRELALMQENKVNAWNFQKHYLLARQGSLFNLILSCVFACVTMMSGYSMIAGIAMPNVRSVHVSLDIDPVFDGLDFTVLSDIHLGPFYNQEHILGLVSKSVNLSASMLLISGNLSRTQPPDIVDSLLPLFRIPAPLGVYAMVSSDFFNSQKTARIRASFGSEFTVLSNSLRTINYNGKSIAIIGIADRDLNATIDYYKRLVEQNIPLTSVRDYVERDFKELAKQEILRNFSELQNMDANDVREANLGDRPLSRAMNDPNSLLEDDLLSSSYNKMRRISEVLKILESKELVDADMTIFLASSPRYAREVSSLSNYNIDLMFAGGTFGGLSYLTSPLFKAANNGFVRGGYKVDEHMHLYVSSGSQVPLLFPFRLGTSSEVTKVTLHSNEVHHSDQEIRQRHLYDFDEYL